MANLLFPSPPPLQGLHLAIYVQSSSRDIFSVSNANTLHLATAVATTAVTSPVRSSTQYQASPGTHVAVFMLMGLEEPPSACAVPLLWEPCFNAFSEMSPGI